MKLACDLHIHSCLSPCGEEEMTPNNIVGMSVLKKLDVVALTDHNTAGNVPAALSVAEQMGLILIPGVEVSTAEDVHLLVYFADGGKCREFGGIIYDSLPDIPLRADIFGRQVIMNDMDEEVGGLDKLLTSASGYSFNDAVELAVSMGGVPVPAHVNKPAYSLFANLGFMPPGLPIRTVEVYKSLPVMGDVSGYGVTNSSDAHQLGDILEPSFYIDVYERSREAVVEALKNGLTGG